MRTGCLLAAASPSLVQRFLMTFLRWAMPPAPTSIAAPPSPRSRVSWNPAVPPPPVGGAPFGIGLVLGGDGDEFPGRAVEGLADGLGDGLFERVAPGLGVVPPGLGVVPPGLGVVVRAGPLEETAGLAEVLLVGEDVGGSAAEDEDVVQADTAAQANMAAMPQPTARHLAELAPVPTFMETSSSPAPTEGRSPKAPRAI
jgi:hypothetical protein